MANFSPVRQAEISAWFLEQIFLKRHLRLHEESFSPGKRAEKPHVIRMKFQSGLKSEVTWVEKCTWACAMICFQGNKMAVWAVSPG